MTRSATPGARVIRPLRDFLATESAGGVALLVATLIALVWANSPWQDSYAELWSTEITVGIGSHVLSMDLQHWVNDGLMTLFFFVVGLEIKRELVTGELRDPRAAVLPAIAAVGGMVVPAALFIALNRSGEGFDGWGIPMATDIAMAVGILSLFSKRVPPSLKLFLLALAIVDDIGAILVIAIFYSAGIELIWLLEGAVVVGAMVLLRALGVTRIAPFVVLGMVLWFTIHESGVHATIAGVVLGLLTPTRPFQRAELIDEDDLTDLSTVDAVRETATLAKQSVSVVEYLEHVLHPWTSLLIVPLFALANAGVTVTGGALSDAFSSSVTQGIVLGLVVGKFVGITSFTWFAQRTGVAVLPKGADWRGLLAVAAIGGIGFTVSLFVASLAFTGDVLDEAKIGILVGSLVAAVGGTLLLLRLPKLPFDERGGNVMADRLTGNVAVVTGAGSGLGRASALALASEGASVVVSDVNDDGGNATVASIASAGGIARYVHTDVTSASACEELVRVAVETYGVLHILHNNAGIVLPMADGFTPDVDPALWDRVIATNLSSVFYCCHFAVPEIAKAGGGSIINTASSMAHLPLGGLDGYAASKGGVALLTQSMAPNCGPLGVRVNAISPGYVDTPMNALIWGSDELKAGFERGHATGLQTAEEIADIVVFLASDDSRSLTGAVLTCDRGWTAFKSPDILRGG